MTLRTRLVAVLLALATVGLLILGAVTYASQRSFLNQRVDQQAHSAVPAVGRALDVKSGESPSQLGERPPGLDRDDGTRRRPPDAGGPIFANLPPGTYGQRRSASGETIDVTLSYGQKALAKPKLPSSLRPGDTATVDSRGDGPRYRVLASRTPGSAVTTIVAIPLAEADQTLDRLLLVEGLVIAGVLLALALFSWLVVRIGLRPLARMGDSAAAIAGGDLARRVAPATERTEVGRLGLALNAMLDKLERAFGEQRASEERLRRFLADASHELRTPLASIRGYAELFRLGAAGDEAERAKALRRIEQEAARMGVLVEDLLTLARLDESREQRRESLDFAALARDAVGDARAQAPERQIQLTQAEAGATVSGDPDRLRQVLANLLANALAHTPPNAAIEVSVRRVDAEVSLAVRDHGPGLPTEDPDQLFGRFWRSTAGRGRGPAGAGLGLAIVAAVTEAHGGRVAATNADGGGAVFEVVLPLADASSPGSVAAQCAASS